jgi:hypothetical protein
MAVLIWRGDIMDVNLAIGMRIESHKNFSGDAQAFMQLVRRISRLEFHGYDAVNELKAMLGHVEKGRQDGSQNVG